MLLGGSIKGGTSFLPVESGRGDSATSGLSASLKFQEGVGKNKSGREEVTRTTKVGKATVGNLGTGKGQTGKLGGLHVSGTTWYIQDDASGNFSWKVRGIDF